MKRMSFKDKMNYIWDKLNFIEIFYRLLCFIIIGFILGYITVLLDVNLALGIYFNMDMPTAVIYGTKNYILILIVINILIRKEIRVLFVKDIYYTNGIVSDKKGNNIINYIGFNKGMFDVKEIDLLKKDGYSIIEYDDKNTNYIKNYKYKEGTKVKLILFKNKGIDIYN